jgi:hypothetical protein
MAKCKCGRPIENGEDTCPNCASNKDSFWKKVIVGLAIALVGGGGAAAYHYNKKNNKDN